MKIWNTRILGRGERSFTIRTNWIVKWMMMRWYDTMIILHAAGHNADNCINIVIFDISVTVITILLQFQASLFVIPDFIKQHAVMHLLQLLHFILLFLLQLCSGFDRSNSCIIDGVWRRHSSLVSKDVTRNCRNKGHL